MHGRLARARGPAYRLGAWTSVRSPSYAREVRCGERRTLARVCYCRRPYGPCAHRCYLFSCARNARGLCCVRVPRYDVHDASQRQRPIGGNDHARRPLPSPPSRFERSRASLDLLQMPTASARLLSPSCGLAAWVSQGRAMLQVRRAAPIW